MNYRLIAKTIGHVLRYEAYFLFIPLLIAFIYQEKAIWGFIITMIILLFITFLLNQLKTKKDVFNAREGLITVALSWILLAFFGSFPFYFSGYFNSFIDCFFEAVSGFTTTGATILTNIEIVDKSILFWRSFSLWIGGMGILVFILALVPSLNATSIQLMKMESPGPTTDKVVPKVRETAKYMYTTYLVLTLVVIIVLLLTGMPLFEACIYGLGTAGTGGFATNSYSLANFSALQQNIITFFMLVFGVNFSMYFLLHKRKYKNIFKDEELRLYVGIFLLGTIIVSYSIRQHMNINIIDSIRHAAFQVSAMITTTGYATIDYNIWPLTAKYMLLMIMLIGGCAGSTAGGLKIKRLLVLLKTIKQQIHHIIHPNSVKTIKSEGKTLDNKIVHSITSFFFIYILTIIIGTLLISLDNFDFATSFSAALSAVSNIGPGLNVIGPMGNFSTFSEFSKLVISFCMLAGRLEIYPMLILFSPSIWKK